MIASDPYHHNVHRLVPRRKIKTGSTAVNPYANKSSGASAAVEISANQNMGGSSFNTIQGNKTDYAGAAASTVHNSDNATRHILEVTPDKTKPPSSDSSSDESEDERAKLIAEINVSKLSPGIDLNSMGNYELLRLRNIQRNEAKLASLGLVGLTSKDKKPKPKPVKKTPKKRAAPVKNSPYVYNQQSNWHTRYDELCGFHKQHGHVTVPKAMKTLSGWTQRQKTQYKNYRSGTKHSLDGEKLRLLKELGVDEFWCGGSTKKKAATKKSVHIDEDEIGSLDSYSEYESSSDVSSDRKISKQELYSLKSPKWMNDRSNMEYKPYFSRRKKNSVVKDVKRIDKRLSVDEYSEHNKFDRLSDSKPKHRVTTSNATKTDMKQKLKAVFSDEDTESGADRLRSKRRPILQNYSDDESSKQHRKNNYNRRSGNKKCYDEGSDSDYYEDSKRCRDGTDKSAKGHRLRYYSDDESVEYNRRLINSLRPSRKREKSKLSKHYSDDELGSVGKNGPQSITRDQKRQIASSKARRTSTRSSLEMIESNREVNTPHLNHRPSKRKGVVSEESERPSKRLCRGHATKYYDSETTETYESDERSYTTLSTFDASTGSRSLYDHSKPVNEIFITKATQSFATRNRPNNKLRELMSERSELMLEYEFLYSSNVEKMRKMPHLICDMQDIEQVLIESGSTLFNRVEGTEYWLKRAEAQRVVMLQGSLVRPEISMLQRHTSRLMEANGEGPISRPQKVLPKARYAGMIEGASLSRELTKLSSE